MDEMSYTSNGRSDASGIANKGVILADQMLVNMTEKKIKLADQTLVD